MPVSPTYPGVYVQELPSQSHAITGVATSITAFVGYTARGIDNRAEVIFSFSDYERSFGGLQSDSELGYAVQQFFANGGSTAYVVRVPRPGGAYATVSLSDLTFTALSKGGWANDQILIDIDWNNINPTTSPKSFNLTITNLLDGTTESFPAVSVDSSSSRYVLPVVNDFDNGSQLVSVSQTLPAATTAPAVTGTVGAPISAPAVTLAVGGTPLSGTVAVTQGSNTITGSGFTAALHIGRQIIFGSDTTHIYTISAVNSDTQATLSSNFAGATAATASATLWSTNATKDFWLTFSVNQPTTPPSALPLQIKVFASGSPVPQSLAGLASQLALTINRTLALAWPGASVQCSPAITTNGATGLRVVAFFPASGIDDRVTLTVPTTAGAGDAASVLGFEAAGATVNVAHYALGTGNAWGSQPAAVVGADGTGLPGTGDLIGDQLAFTGLYALEKVDLFNLLSIPDATRAAPGNPSALDPAVDPNAIFSSAIAYCATRRAFLLVDSPPGVNNVPTAIDWKTSGLTVHDDHGAAFFPRLRLPDPLNSFQLRTFAPSGVVAGLYASIDASRGVWKAPAGTEAVLSGVQGMVYKLSDAENGALNPLGLNCLRMMPVYGPVLWGARTLVGSDAEANQWKYVPVRRLALFIEQSLIQGMQWAVFEPNDEPLWASIRLNVGSFMNQLFRQGAFQGKTPADAYLVKCDSETTAPADIARGVVNVLVGFAPLTPAEFVVIQIEQLAGQSQT
jgi:phage tail sheath protein FI